MKFLIYLDEFGFYRFKLNAGNGKTVLQSFSNYEEREECLRVIHFIIKNSKESLIYNILKTKECTYQFLLKSISGKTLAKSLFYKNYKTLELGVLLIRLKSVRAQIEDEVSLKSY